MSPTLQKTFFGLLFLAALFFIIERLIGRVRGPVLRKGWLTDVLYFFLTPFVTKNLTRLALFVPLGLLVWMGFTSTEALKSQLYTGFGPLSRQPLWLQAVEIYALGDLLSYWMHRIFHGGKWWAFHAVHHSSEELDWLSSVRVHPFNDLMTKLVQVTPLLFLGFNPLVTASSAVFVTLYAIFLHARLNWDFGPLRYVIATPMFHRWHHSRQREAWDKNFAGLLPVWDLMFGTFYMPRGKVPEDFGVYGGFPQGMAGQLWLPVKELWTKRAGQAGSIPARVEVAAPASVPEA